MVLLLNTSLNMMFVDSELQLFIYSYSVYKSIVVNICEVS